MKVEISDSEFDKCGNTPEQLLESIMQIAADPLLKIVGEMARRHPGLCREYVHLEFKLKTDTGHSTGETRHIAFHVRPS